MVQYRKVECKAQGHREERKLVGEKLVIEKT